MWRAHSALAIFQLSGPRLASGMSLKATSVATTVATDPSRKTDSSLPVSKKTRRRSAANRSIGIASGNSILLTTAYCGASQGMSPTLLISRPSSVATSAPLSAFPTFVFSDHSPSAPAAASAAHTTHGSLGLKGAATTCAPTAGRGCSSSQRRAPRSCGALMRRCWPIHVGPQQESLGATADRGAPRRAALVSTSAGRRDTAERGGVGLSR
mmetsp:Transcript_9195/g.23505  ORF Transcript_9195/g.23505 Transcript_9195/m.23505 type:complete len:211 (-) Transcript_9195:174-806(-)